MARTKEKVSPPVIGGTRVPKVEMLPAQVIQPAAYNPRKCSPAMFESLKAGIRKFGFVESLVVQRRSEQFGPMVLVGGHQRLKAVREIAIEDNTPVPDLPCVVLDLPDREAKMLNVALNNVSGEFDTRLLGELLEDIHSKLPLGDVDAGLMGFEQDELSRLLKLADPPKVNSDALPTFARSVTLSLEFTDVETRDAVKTKLADLARAEERKTGDLVFGLLSTRRKK